MSGWQQVMPDDHSEVVPLLPIPNRTVKRLCADDSADSRVKVGHCQATIRERPCRKTRAFSFCASDIAHEPAVNTQRAAASQFIQQIDAPGAHVDVCKVRSMRHAYIRHLIEPSVQLID